MHWQLAFSQIVIGMKILCQACGLFLYIIANGVTESAQVLHYLTRPDHGLYQQLSYIKIQKTLYPSLLTQLLAPLQLSLLIGSLCCCCCPAIPLPCCHDRDPGSGTTTVANRADPENLTIQSDISWSLSPKICIMYLKGFKNINLLIAALVHYIHFMHPYVFI